MTKHCKLCGDLLEDDEQERGICEDCMHKGFLELGEALGRMKDTE